MKRTIYMKFSSRIFSEDGSEISVSFIHVGPPNITQIKRKLRSISDDHNNIVKHFMDLIKKHPDKIKFNYKKNLSQINTILSDTNQKVASFSFSTFNVLPVEEEKKEIKIQMNE